MLSANMTNHTEIIYVSVHKVNRNLEKFRLKSVRSKNFFMNHPILILK